MNPWQNPLPRVLLWITMSHFYSGVDVGVSADRFGKTYLKIFFVLYYYRLSVLSFFCEFLHLVI
jgi:hypothetical protein